MLCRGCGRNVENMCIAFDIPEVVLHELLDPVAMPQMARVGYLLPTPAPLDDTASVVHEQVHRADVAGLVRPGQRIAIGVGSRGIAHLSEIVAALVHALRSLGAAPFVVPAMG